ncbi:MAG TPA: DUF3618 domain-containing protein [Gemmatimonadaceae bacterium]|nr:DUF3618 domain-containing protein [Gemmatimonadaceae bacterium]
MAETTADVRRDIELTRERMSSTIEELEHKLNVKQLVRDHPWSAIGLALGAGILLSGSRADVKAAAATSSATKGTGAKLGSALDGVVAGLVTAATGALHSHVDRLVGEVTSMLGGRPEGARSYGVGPADVEARRAPFGLEDINRAD